MLTKAEELIEESVSGNAGVGNSNDNYTTKGGAGFNLPQQNNSSNVGEIDNIVMDELVDINRIRFNNAFTNKQMSTCPILPKYHVTYGSPIDRQEISAEYEQRASSDPKKALA